MKASCHRPLSETAYFCLNQLFIDLYILEISQAVHISFSQMKPFVESYQYQTVVPTFLIILLAYL